MNLMKPENCNKAMCKTCIFQTNGHQAQLTVGRWNEILNYLAKGESSHICHTTEKTCYGGLEFQAKIFFFAGILSEPTPQALLKKAQEVLGFNKEK